MGRVLGIDYGKKRVGLALSDPLSMFATGLDTVTVKNERQLLKHLQALIAEHRVETIVLGLPLRNTGEAGDAAQAVQQFGKQLQALTQLPVFYEDERFTSVIAQQSLQAQGVSPSRHKHLIDKTSAMLILQQYLDKRYSY